MARLPGPSSPLSSFRLVIAILGMIALPAALTLHRVHVSTVVDPSVQNPSPYGYTVSLLLFIVPILVIGLWLAPKDGVKISKRSFVWTIGLLFPVGAALDFFFARVFLKFPNPGATLRWTAPALGGGVPVEEYIFYFTGFVAVLLIYIWMDEYWLAAYSVPVDSAERTNFARLLRFHPQSLIWAVGLILVAIVYRRYFVSAPGFPGYFIFLVIGALGPSAALLPSALPVINWRAFSLTAVIILLISLLWEATLGVPYGWWGFQDAQMIGIRITAWSQLPIEEVFVWLAVTYATAIVYEIVRRWQSSGKRAKHAFLG
jgi:lycopene cyclase domain-containing protein